MSFGREILMHIKVTYVEFQRCTHRETLFGGKVSYGPIPIKFGRDILPYIKLIYAEFHRYTRIFKSVMTV